MPPSLVTNEKYYILAFLQYFGSFRFSYHIFYSHFQDSTYHRSHYTIFWMTAIMLTATLILIHVLDFQIVPTKFIIEYRNSVSLVHSI